jgi:hypothetical protein
MDKVVCFKHRATPCDCHEPAQYQPKTDRLIDRKMALELYYACRAFRENIIYTPEAMRQVVQCYLTVADALVGGPEALVEALGLLRKAGFDGK